MAGPNSTHFKSSFTGGGKEKKSSAVLFCSKSGIPQLMFVFTIDFLNIENF